MKTYTQDQLNEIVGKHKLWLDNKESGERADLRWSDLSGSDLSGSDLRGSNLSGSNLSNSNLSGSNLSGSDLSNSNLSGADLRNSKLSRSDLSNSNLSGSNLSGVNGREINTFLSVAGIGSAKRQTLWWVEEDKIWCGCFQGTMAEFEAMVEETHEDNPRHLKGYRAAIQFLKSCAGLALEVVK